MERKIVDERTTKAIWETAVNNLTCDGSAAPVILGYCHGIGIVGGHIPDLTPEKKRFEFMAASQLAKTFNADALLFVSEAWMKKMAPGEAMPDKPLEQMPDAERTEVLILQTAYPDGTGEMLVAEIKRTEDSKPTVETPNLMKEVGTPFPPWWDITLN
jgi:hypothetical protein